jgi:radical SAM superfamily enzyme YgiQ (UPF0313 family)
LTSTKGKVLLLYPNSEGLGGIPNGLALLSGCLKRAGFETSCFDTTFLNSPPLTHYQRAKHGYFMEADNTKYWGKWTDDLPKRIPSLLIETVKEFKPDLIAVSQVDVGIMFLKTLLKNIKDNFDIPIIAGGITCTSSPELVIENEYIDMICVGEGEMALVEVAEAIVNGKDYSNINNLWVKKNGEIIKNPLRPLINMEELPFQDWSIFDERHYYKPYCGDFRRTAFVEMARGCHFNCNYCVNNTLRRMYKDLGSFIRNRSIDRTFDEICYLKELYNLELLFFIDDNFLGMHKERFNKFCEDYKNKVDLPFYIQTRSETVKEEYVKKLKDINISTIAIGVEHGNEEFRRKYMNRKMSNESIQKAFDIVHKYDIRTTANIIIGMPHETEAMMGDTIELLKRLKPKSVSINYFTPYRGIAMRDMAIEEGIIPEDHVITETNVCLDMPQFRTERIKHYYDNLKKYVSGELEFEII